MPNQGEKSSKVTTKKFLAALDFDQTICNDNTDLVARALLDQDLLTPELEQIINESGWTQYMSEIFKLLHKSNISKSEIINSIKQIPEVPGMIELIKTLKNINFDLIIISDSNSVFIEEWLRNNFIYNHFDMIFTNPAEFNDHELLNIKPFHHQIECGMSSRNLCKGKILDDYAKKRLKDDNIKYESVFYIGDGNNDICPVLRLKSNDYGCPRINYSMDRKLNKNPNMGVKCNLIKWSSGMQLLNAILALIKQDTFCPCNKEISED